MSLANFLRNKNAVPSEEKKQRDKAHRREQLKKLIIDKFRTKYAYGVPSSDDRDKIITEEVNTFIQNEKCTEKNLLELDKKLQQKFSLEKSERASQASGSRRFSNRSHASNKLGSEKSNRSAIAKAGLNITSQERQLNSSYNHRSPAMQGKPAYLNRSFAGGKKEDEWDKIIRNDMRKFEQEQHDSLLKKQQIKRQIMSDLKNQMQEKQKMRRENMELEKELERKRLNITHEQEKRQKQQELVKNRKHAEEKKIMESQIAELENLKKLEQYNERVQAEAEKEQAKKALQDEITREKRKKQEYMEVCQKQYQENMQLKDHIKKQELQRRKDEAAKKQDMFGDMFEEKKHISYEYAARNQKKFDALNKILEQEHIRTNKVRNYAEFEEGVNSLERKNKLDSDWKENRLKENLRMNRNFLEEQIKYRKKQERFEKDLALNQARAMNDKAQQELENETQRMKDLRKKRIEFNNELKTQMNFRENVSMTEQERLLNKQKLEQAD